LNAFLGFLLLTNFFYKLFFDWTWLVMYAVLLVAYTGYIFNTRVSRDNGKRKTLMFATWNEPNDPTGFYVERFNVTKAMEYLEKLNKENPGTKITMTHILGHAFAKGLKKVEQHVGHVVFGNFRRDKELGTTVLVDVEGGADLVPITIWGAHDISIVEFARQCNEKVDKAKHKKDK